MKKLIMTVAVLACAGIVSAQVYSENIVGYAKEGVSGLTIKSVQFSGTAGGITLDDAFSGLVSGDKVIVWNGSYTTYTYYGPTYGWLDAGFNPAGSVVIPSGAGVWLQNSAAADVITAGEVPSAASIDVAVVTGLNMLSNPYPVALALDDMPTGLTSGDKVIVWNGSYTTYTYYGPTYGWLDAGFNPAGTVEIGVGKGFWLSAQAPVTLTFNKAF